MSHFWKVRCEGIENDLKRAVAERNELRGRIGKILSAQEFWRLGGMTDEQFDRTITITMSNATGQPDNGKGEG